MKKILLLIPLVLCLLASSVLAQSIPGTLTQQSPTRLDASSNCQTVTAAAAAAATLTVTPTGGNSVYITYLEITNYASALETGNAAPNLVTITGISGSPIISMATGCATVGSICDRYIMAPDLPVKGTAPGTNFVVTTPAFAGALWRINSCFYFAP